MSWVRRGITSLILVIVLALAILFGGSALVMRRSVDAELPRIKALTDPANIIEGARLSGIMGCTSCHGPMVRGRLLTGVPWLGQIVAPSLPEVAAQATDEQIARAIRNGVGIDARPMFIMPSDAFNHLSDDDVARLIGWIRSLPTTAFDVVGRTPVGVRGRFAILTRQLPDSVTLVRDQSPHRPADIGRYLAQTSCGQCHALDQDRKLGVGDVAPALARAGTGYDAPALAVLLRTGKAKGNRAAPMMGAASAGGLGQLSDAEIGAIDTYLKALPGRHPAH